MPGSDIVVLAFIRTPFGRYFGSLRDIAAHSLGARAVDALLAESAIPPVEVEGVYAGVGMAAAGTFTPARRLILESALPQTTPSVAIDRACCSGMTAIGQAWRSLMTGRQSLVVCGGFDNLSRTPILATRQRKTKPGDEAAWDKDGPVYDPLLLKSPIQGKAIADYTGDEALAHGVTREMQDEWALRSHEAYFAAEADGFFADERMTLPELATDEEPRENTSLEMLARLGTIYQSATVTPGNAPGLSDGAAFLVLATADKALELGVPPLAKLLDYAETAGPPTAGSHMPAVAIETLLQRNSWSIDDLTLLEINEAYAATPLVSTQILAAGDRGKNRSLLSKMNVHGGAVALGHPLGASGARITMTLINSLHADGGGRGAAAICGGYGQGDGLLVEV